MRAQSTLPLFSCKRCFKCSAELPLTEFYRHPRMADGHLGKCKECTKRDVRENRATRIDYYHAYDKKRRPILPKATTRKAYTKSEICRRRRQRHPDKYFANYTAGNAIKLGHLIRQPCERCGSIKVDAHHEDYTKPLDVTWLCRPCHRERHKEMKRRTILNGMSDEERNLDE